MSVRHKKDPAGTTKIAESLHELEPGREVGWFFKDGEAVGHRAPGGHGPRRRIDGLSDADLIVAIGLQRPLAGRPEDVEGQKDGHRRGATDGSGGDASATDV